ncbi:hypothetical protein KGY64_01705 [Candidatus Bipolaricaulota bacterium]|nr:hypothetical protein [Candidatus Bipolaricaulota bacterium]
MKASKNGNWKIILIVGAIIFVGLLFFGWIISASFALLAAIIKGLGVLLGNIIRYAFSSPVNILILGVLGYGGYKIYKKYFSRKQKSIEYTESDFEHGDDQHYEWR